MQSRNAWPQPTNIPITTFPFLPHYTMNKMGKERELKRKIFPEIPVCAINPFGQPFKGTGSSLLAIILMPQRLRLKGEPPKPFSQKGSVANLKFSFSNPPQFTNLPTN